MSEQFYALADEASKLTDRLGELLRDMCALLKERRNIQREVKGALQDLATTAREESLQDLVPGPVGCCYPSHWFLADKTDPLVLAALEAGDHPGRTSPLLDRKLPFDPGNGYEMLKCSDELHGWPAGDPLTVGPNGLLNEVHAGGVKLVGGRKVLDLWARLGVKVCRGAHVTGYQARLFAQAVCYYAREGK